jgi:hypothetical protein
MSIPQITSSPPVTQHGEQIIRLPPTTQVVPESAEPKPGLIARG